MARNESHGCSSKEKFEEKVSILIQGIINKKEHIQLFEQLFIISNFFFLVVLLFVGSWLQTFICITLIYIVFNSNYPQKSCLTIQIIEKLSPFHSSPASLPTMKNQPHPRYNCPSETIIKSPSAASIRSQKALKLLILDSNNNKPFKRKQEAKGNRKNQFEDLGKVITNTSFGVNPDIKKIVSTSPKHYFGLHQNWQHDSKTQCIKATLRENRSITDIEKIRENKVTNKKGNYNEKAVDKRQDINKNILADLRQDNSQKAIQDLKIKLSDLRRDHEILEGKSKVLRIQISQLNRKIAQKQDQISYYNKELSQKTEQLKQQSELNKCLQDMISKFNQKQEHEMKRITNLSTLSKQNELRKEVEQLKQTVYGFNKMVNALQIQNSVIQKLRHQLEKQRQSNRSLQREVKYLKQKINGITKSNKTKISRFLVKQQLDYSVSFDLQ